MLIALPVQAATPDWTISESSGSVIVVRAQGGSAKAARGTALRQGDTITTGTKSRAVIIRKQEFITISANSRVVVTAAKAGSMVQIVQQTGTAIYKIKKKTTPHFAVETPYLAAVVKGTTFSVNVGKFGASVQVIEGRVQVVANKGAAEHLLTPGKIGLVEAASPGRLTVQGEGDDVVIESSNAVSGAPVETPPAGAGVEPATDEVRISEDVTEEAIRLERFTDGLVSGDSSLRSMTIAMARLDIPPPAPPVADIDVGDSGDSGSDNGKGGGGDDGTTDDGGDKDGNSGGNGDADGGGTGDDGGAGDDDGTGDTGGSDTGGSDGSGTGGDDGDKDQGGKDDDASDDGDDKGGKDDDDGKDKDGKDDDDKDDGDNKGGKDKGGKGDDNDADNSEDDDRKDKGGKDDGDDDDDGDNDDGDDDDDDNDDDNDDD